MILNIEELSIRLTSDSSSNSNDNNRKISSSVKVNKKFKISYPSFDFEPYTLSACYSNNLNCICVYGLGISSNTNDNDNDDDHILICYKISVLISFNHDVIIKKIFFFIFNNFNIV